MNQPVSIKFYLNEHKSRAGKLPVFLRLITNRKKSEVYTGFMVDPSDWDDKRERTKRNATINAGISAIENEIYEIVNNLNKEGKIVTAPLIKILLRQHALGKTNILDFYDDHLRRLEQAGEVKIVTVRMYRYTRNHLAKFIREVKKAKDIPLMNVDYKFISDFDLFLMTQDSVGTGIKLERNTVSKHHSRVRTILIRAIKEGIIDKNPYNDFKLKKTPSSRTHLDADELKALVEHDLGGNESLIKVRDIFVFSVYTGLRFEDAQNLTVDKIVKGSNGKYTLSMDQGKTERQLTIPLLKPAINILEKYADIPERIILQRVLPSMSNQKLNSYLKVIGQLVGLRKHLTHHVARHTCATTVLLSNDVPIEVVSKWLGHTNLKTTQIYAKITDNYMQRIAGKLDEQMDLDN